MNQKNELDSNTNFYFHDDQLDQNQTIWGEFGFGVRGPPDNCRMAQSFKPTLNVLTRVGLYLNYGEGGGEINLAIRINLNSSDLTSKTIKASDIPSYPNWTLFNFPDIFVIPEQSYYIVLQSDDYETNCVWECNSNNPYDRGDAWEKISNHSWSPFLNYDFCFKTYGFNEYPPCKPETPSGLPKGKPGTLLFYSTRSIDPENKKVFYLWDWGDGNQSVWLGPYLSGITAITSWIYTEPGMYPIKVKAKDSYGCISEWSEPLLVMMPRTRALYNFNWLSFLERFPILDKILNLINC